MADVPTTAPLWSWGVADDEELVDSRDNCPSKEEAYRYALSCIGDDLKMRLTHGYTWPTKYTIRFHCEGKLVLEKKISFKTTYISKRVSNDM